MRATTRVVGTVLATVTFVATVQAQAPPAATSQPAKQEQTVVIIPLQGPIEYELTVRLFCNALRAAQAKKPAAMVIKINSPGGVVEYMSEMLAELKKVSSCRTVAWIDGKEHGAFSAAAILACGCDEIIMAPGNAIGAAVPYIVTASSKWPMPVSEKFRSALHGQIRAIAEEKGHPWPVIRAWLTPRAGLYRIRQGDKARLVNYDDIRNEEELPAVIEEIEGQVQSTYSGDPQSQTVRHTWRIRRRISVDTGPPKDVEVICPRGRVLTLTDQEAVELGLATAVCASEQDVLKKLGLPKARISRIPEVTKVVETTLERTLAKVKSLLERGQRAEKMLSLYRYKEGFKRRALMYAEQAARCYLGASALLDKYKDLRSRPEIARMSTNLQSRGVDLKATAKELRMEIKEDRKPKRRRRGIW